MSTAEVRNLRVCPGGYAFRISAGPKAFQQAVNRLKQDIPHGPGGRIWDDEYKIWFVSNAFEKVLTQTFRNFESSKAAILAQATLPL